MKNDPSGKEIIELLYNSGLIKIYPRDNKKGWILHSKKWSPFYINLRPIFSQKNCRFIMDKIGNAMCRLIHEEVPQATKIVGIATTGIPIATIISYKSEIPLCYTRKIADKNIRSVDDFDKYLIEIDKHSNGDNDYGEHAFLEGEFDDNDNMLLVDDLITVGGSKLIANRIVQYTAEKCNKNIVCTDAAVIIDREQGGFDELKEHGISLHSVIPFKTKGIHWLRNKLSDEEFEIIQDYLEDDSKYQNENYRRTVLKIR